MPDSPSEANAIRVELLKRPPRAPARKRMCVLTHNGFRASALGPLLVWKGLAYLLCSPAKGKTSSGPAYASAFLPDRLDAEKDLFGCFGIPALLLLLISESSAE